MAHAEAIPAAPGPTVAPSPLRWPILLGLVSAVLLDFCFPVAGPLPHWRAALAFIALVPLLIGLLNERSAAHPRYLRRAALTGYLSGVVWYILNCYWIYQTMLYYGHVPPLGSVGILILYSAILGLYFGLFGFLLAFFRRRFGLGWALLLAPFLWTAIELAAARITSVPWDQLGYSQIDDRQFTMLAPITGVYGISFVIVLYSALLTSVVLGRRLTGSKARLVYWVFIVVWGLDVVFVPIRKSDPPAPTSDYAVLLQPNINVEFGQPWSGDQWMGNPGWILNQVQDNCPPSYQGMPDRNKPLDEDYFCPQPGTPPGVVLWPEVASWFRSDDPRTQAILHAVATTAHAPFIAGMMGVDPSGEYNSAVFTNADGSVQGRYDKIHLVPFGEYIPLRNLLFFAHHLTNQVGDFNRGARRTVFSADGHTFGVFICYESVFADEIRHFALNGAQVLVNLSDDGWYGDTSAPWQHLNMARMRAIENRRWILRDTNNGITTVIDPYGRVTFSAPRHQLTSLVARYGYRSDLTFYTRYGDVFAYLCCAVVLAALAASLRRRAVSR